MNLRNLYKKAKRKVPAVVSGLAALSLAGIGCGDEMEIEDVLINGYNVSIFEDSRTRYICIGTLNATDWNRDGRFDEIDLSRVSKGHPLEAYANPDSLEAMWNRALQEGATQ
jgi:hypothetical protein